MAKQSNPKSKPIKPGSKPNPPTTKRDSSVHKGTPRPPKR